MWMNSRFAQWDVEGEVRERVNGALHQWERERLARTARSGEARHTPASVLSAVYAALERLARLAMVGLGGVRWWPRQWQPAGYEPS
jgi:hypothetical protein